MAPSNLEDLESPDASPSDSPGIESTPTDAETSAPSPGANATPQSTQEPEPESLTDVEARSIDVPGEESDGDFVCPPAIARVQLTPGNGQVHVAWDTESRSVTQARSVTIEPEITESSDAGSDVPEPTGSASTNTNEQGSDSGEQANPGGEDSDSHDGELTEGDAELSVGDDDGTQSHPADINSVEVGSTASITHFLVQISPSDRLLTVASEERSSTITGLRNGVEYAFTVFAVNDLGRGIGQTGLATPLTGMEGEVAGVLVKLTADVPATGLVPGSDRVDVVDLTFDREVADEVHLVEFSDAVDAVTAAQIAQDLEADPGVEWAEPDQFVFISQSDTDSRAPPDDPLFPQEQWNLWGDYGVGVAEGPGALNPAWSPDLGAGVTVAVIDTGITAHPDLEGQTVGGFDFVSNPANLAAPREPGGPDVDFDADGEPGWDGDPTDPGDWRKVAPVRDSTWHGTHIAGIIAARAANGEGITGLAPGARIQPVRAISWRGGLLSDITAAITWASGGAIPGVPTNTTPSKVLNLSFTLQSPCTPALQAAITAANTRGSIVIAAAGNANDDVAGYAPANCDGTIAVAATGRDGKRAPYSNYGPGIDIAAPGGSLTVGTGVLSTSNPGYATREGTSIAVAHVTAITTRYLAANPTATPTDTRNHLTSRQAVRPFADGTCDPDTSKACGTGITALVQIASSDPACTPEEATFVGNGTNGLTGTNYITYAFKSTGSCSFEVPEGVTSFDYLIVGGGGGGAARHGGGGGGGGFVEGSDLSVTPGASIAISVGAGGIGTDVGHSSNNGSPSTVVVGSRTITAYLGGGGYAFPNAATVGSTGGTNFSQAPASTTTGQGNSGGSGLTHGGCNAICGGGGGGAGSPGSVAGAGSGGNGGDGKPTTLITVGVANALSVGEVSGASVYFAGGGGGGVGPGNGAGAGGRGGGGSGSSGVVASSNAAPNTGGGGGGSGYQEGVTPGQGRSGDGGSGVVLLRAVAPNILFQESFTEDTIRNAADWAGSGSSGFPCLTARTSTSGSISLGSGVLAGCSNSPDVVGRGSLRLTTNANWQRSTLIYTKPQSTLNGLDISFKLGIYGGNGADGISFYLKKGTSTNYEAGDGEGAGLGYTGIRDALLGIGFDKYGNFSNGGWYMWSGCGATAGPGFRAGAIVIRGPGTWQGIRQAQDYSGYCYLAGTSAGAVDFSGANRAAATKNIRIVIDPGTQVAPEIKVYVNNVLTLTAPQPAELINAGTFKFGFSGATGGLNDIHEIWNFRIAKAVDVVAPGPPQTVTAIAGAASATVSWLPPENNGGSAVTGYTATAAPGGQSCTSSGTSCTVTGLSSDRSYSFSVVARNRVGTGAPSSSSTQVFPLPPSATSSGDDDQKAGGASGPNRFVPGNAPNAAESLVVSRPGSALVRVVDVNGRPVRGEGELPVVVVPLPGRDGKVVRASSWDVELQGVEASGVPAALNAAGNLEVVQGRGLATSGRGFAADSPVGVYLFSEPRTLGTLMTDARGVFSGVLPVPGDVPVGVHTAQVSGYTAEGDILIVSLGIEVAAPQTSPLISPVPSRVQPLWWMPVTNAGGEVVVSAGSSGCSAVDGEGSPARGRSLVFWNTGTCIFEVRSGGKSWKSFRVPIVAQALKTEGVQEMHTRKVWFTSVGQVWEPSVEILADAVSRMRTSQASYAYWVDSSDRMVQAATARQHAELARQLRARGTVRGIRTVSVAGPWRETFTPRPHSHILIAWKPQ